jgi:hypothetical protein
MSSIEFISERYRTTTMWYGTSASRPITVCIGLSALLLRRWFDASGSRSVGRWFARSPWTRSGWRVVNYLPGTLFPWQNRSQQRTRISGNNSVEWYHAGFFPILFQVIIFPDYITENMFTGRIKRCSGGKRSEHYKKFSLIFSVEFRIRRTGSGISRKYRNSTGHPVGMIKSKIICRCN